MIALVTLFGPRLLTGQLMQILFGTTFLADPARADEVQRWRGIVRALPRSLARAAAASARRKAITDELGAITAPTLVISGAEDHPVPPPLALAVHDGIAGSRFIGFPATGHAVQIERPADFNATLDAFLADVARMEQGQ
jgi:3-oxoadipate enol-lactonase